jgi:hypothetical protein
MAISYTEAGLWSNRIPLQIIGQESVRVAVSIYPLPLPFTFCPLPSLCGLCDLCGKEEVAAVSGKCFKFLGNGVDRGADLFFAVVCGDEESQASELLGHSRVQNWLYVDAALKQGV